MKPRGYTMTEAADLINIPRSALMNAVRNHAIPSTVESVGGAYKTRFFFLRKDLLEFKKAYSGRMVQQPTDFTSLKVEADKPPADQAMRIRKRTELLRELHELKSLGISLSQEELLGEGEQSYAAYR